MIPILATLAQAGLSYIADEVVGMTKASAEAFIKNKTGIEIDLSGSKKIEESELKNLKEFDAHLKIVSEQNRHQEAKLAHDLEFFRAENDDRDSARDMQKTALIQTDTFSKRFVYYLATFWSLVGASYILLVTFVDIPSQNVRFADTVLGFLLGTIVATIINFFFGSSKGSADKSALIHDTMMSKKTKGQEILKEF